MRLRLILLSALVALSTAAREPLKYELPARLKGQTEVILKRTGYTTSYNPTTRTANWVAWGT